MRSRAFMQEEVEEYGCVHALEMVGHCVARESECVISS